MKPITNLLKFILIAISLIFVHYAVSYILPPPWNSINIIFYAIIISIIGWGSGISIWLSCLLHFFMELYSVSPFGLILLPGTISIIFAYWLYTFIFTNRSWYTAVALAAIAIISYRILHAFLFIFVEYFDHGLNFPGEQFLFLTCGN